MDADELIAAYLSTLESRLPLGRAERRRIVSEVGDGLSSTVEAHVQAGAPAPDAARLAIEEFGDAGDLAGQFTAAIAPGSARRTGLALLITGPFVGLTWVASAGGGAWTSRVASVLTALPYLPLVLALTVPAAVLAAGGGWLALRHKLSSRPATAAAWAAAFGCIAADATLIATALAHLFSGAQAMTGWVAVAAAASTVRLAGASIASVRHSRLRAAGY